MSLDGSEYDVRVYVPATAAGSNPLVLDLHGSSSNGPMQAGVSGLDALADENGFIVVEPSGVIEVQAYQPLEDGSWAWNVPGVPTTDGEYAPEDARDDVAFLRAVVEQLTEPGCVATQNVFATGYSGGARMASALACEAADLVAAIAPVDGLRAGRASDDDLTALDPATCVPSQAVPVITFHGTADVVNPFAGNDDPRWGYSVESAVSQWASLDGCSTDAAVGTQGAVTITTFAGCTDGAEVQSYFIDGGNHVWPGTEADQSYFGETEWGVDASETMWEFFAGHVS